MHQRNQILVPFYLQYLNDLTNYDIYGDTLYTDDTVLFHVDCVDTIFARAHDDLDIIHL